MNSNSVHKKKKKTFLIKNEYTVTSNDVHIFNCILFYIKLLHCCVGERKNERHFKSNKSTSIDPKYSKHKYGSVVRRAKKALHNIMKRH